jgi:hypothetical protein
MNKKQEILAWISANCCNVDDPELEALMVYQWALKSTRRGLEVTARDPNGDPQPIEKDGWVTHQNGIPVTLITRISEKQVVSFWQKQSVLAGDLFDFCWDNPHAPALMDALDNYHIMAAARLQGTVSTIRELYKERRYVACKTQARSLSDTLLRLGLIDAGSFNGRSDLNIAMIELLGNHCNPAKTVRFKELTEKQTSKAVKGFWPDFESAHQDWNGHAHMSTKFKEYTFCKKSKYVDEYASGRYVKETQWISLRKDVMKCLEIAGAMIRAQKNRYPFEEPALT